jgi:hypothetical protein
MSPQMNDSKESWIVVAVVRNFFFILSFNACVGQLKAVFFGRADTLKERKKKVR